MTLTEHPMCMLFPRMSADELKDLKADIKKRGLLEPIVIHEGKIRASGTPKELLTTSVGQRLRVVARAPGAALVELLSRISGLGLSGLQENLLARHLRAYGPEHQEHLATGGFYRFRQGAETHAHSGPLIQMLQEAVTRGDYALFKKYTRFSNSI